MLTANTAGSSMAAYYLYFHLDDLPHSVRRPLDALVVTDLSHPKPLSKLLAYVIDGYFSTNPYSKTLALLILTIIIVVNGSLAIYVVTGDSLYAAFWQVIFLRGVDGSLRYGAQSMPTMVGGGVLAVRRDHLGLLHEGVWGQFPFVSCQHVEWNFWWRGMGRRCPR